MNKPEFYRKKGPHYDQVETAAKKRGEAYTPLHGASGNMNVAMKQAGCIWDGKRWHAPISIAAQFQQAMDRRTWHSEGMGKCPGCGRALSIDAAGEPFCLRCKP